MNEETTGLKLHDAASPEALLPDHALVPWWAVAMLLALIVIIALYILFRKRKSAMDPEKIRKQAFHEAFQALSDIKVQDPREAAVQSSLIIRRYLSVAAADPALYETHDEFVARRDALQSLNEAARTAADDGFRSLAALKYGPEVPSKPATDIVAESRTLLETLHQGHSA